MRKVIPISSNIPSYENAIRHLNDVSNDSGSSCIRKNNMLPVEVDLQIIVPVYNTAMYIKECIDSILCQKTKYSYKIIIINDGSTDNTREILKQYENNSRVIIVDQENKGFSGARNRGLENIFGKYIMFVDSDDKIFPYAVELLLDKAFKTNSDVVQGGFNRLYNGKLTQGKITPDNDNIDPDNVYGYACMKVFARNLWENLVFPENYWFEDTIMATIVNKQSRKSASISAPVYIYRSNPSSITHTFSGKAKTIDTLWVYSTLLDDAMKLNLLKTEELKIRQLRTFCKQVIIAFQRILYLTQDIKLSMFSVFCYLRKKYFSGLTLDKSDGYNEILRSIDNSSYKDFDRAFFLWISK